MTVEMYETLVENGVMSDDLEFLRGALIEKMPKTPLHTYITGTLLEMLQRYFTIGYLVRKEEPLSLTDSEPEPDIAVVSGEKNDFLSSHPNTAKLVIEVSVSSLAVDLEKAGIYAEAQIPLYILIDANKRNAVVYSLPANGIYVQKTIQSDSIEIVFESETINLKINLADIFPPQ